MCPPDFEAPRGTGAPSGTNTNTYKVVVAAADAATDPQMGYKKVTVKVTNVSETGKVTWTVDHDGGGADTPKLVQFDVDTVLVASATDGDIAGTAKTVAAPGASNLIWRWYRGGTLIQGASTDTYTVVLADRGHRIRVVATYQVGDSTRQETASLTSDYPVMPNRVGPNALKFDPATISRSVAEGKKGATVGARVMATGNHGAVNYTLETGGDAANFEIDQKTGQITTAVDLDYEGTAGAAGNCATLNECTVTVRVTDASGSATAASATDDPPVFVDANVTIKITDVDEKPTFSSGAETVTVAEGVQIVRADSNDDGTFDDSDTANTYVATDQDGLNVNLGLMGPDAARFSLSSAGVLSFSAKPDYEDPGDTNRNNVYEVTVRASDGTMNADRMVRVTVTNLNEPPAISVEPAMGLRIAGSRSASVAEGDTAVATYTASGPDAASTRWSLSGTDAGRFSISSGGALSFRTAPDYENPADANTDNNYSVTVTGTDSEGNSDDIDVTVTVTDVEEVTPSDPLLARFDPNGDGTIEIADMRTAVTDFFGASPDDYRKRT